MKEVIEGEQLFHDRLGQEPKYTVSQPKSFFYIRCTLTITFEVAHEMKQNIKPK